MNYLVRSAIFVGMGAFTVVLCHLFPNAATNPEAGLVMWLPKDTPELSGMEVSISEIEASTLPPDTTYLKMLYREKELPDKVALYRQMAVTLILAGSDRRSLHEPEVCLDGQGWDIEKSTVHPVEVNGQELRVMNLQLSRLLRHEDGSLYRDTAGKKVRYRAQYIYWWVASDETTPFSKERIIKTALNNMFRNVNDRWGYPSILVPVDSRLPLEEGREEALKRAFDFIGTYGPKFLIPYGATSISDSGEASAAVEE